MKAVAYKEETRTAVNTIVSHSVASAILSTIDSEHGNLLLMGWRGNPRERERNIKGEAIKYADCDAAILCDRGLDDVKRILVPTRGGPPTCLSWELPMNGVCVRSCSGASLTVSLTARIARS